MADPLALKISWSVEWPKFCPLVKNETALAKGRSPPVNKPPALCGFIRDSGLSSMFTAAQHNEFVMQWLYNGSRVTHWDLLSYLRLISMQIQVCYAVLLVSYVSLAEGRWGRMWAASHSWVQGYYSSVLMSLILVLYSWESFHSYFGDKCLINGIVCLLLFRSVFLMVCWKRDWIQKHWSLWDWSNKLNSSTRRLSKSRPNYCKSHSLLWNAIDCIFPCECKTYTLGV